MCCAKMAEPIPAGPRKRSTYGHLPITSCISLSASWGDSESGSAHRKGTMTINSLPNANSDHRFVLQTPLIFPTSADAAASELSPMCLGFSLCVSLFLNANSKLQSARQKSNDTTINLCSRSRSCSWCHVSCPKQVQNPALPLVPPGSSLQGQRSTDLDCRVVILLRTAVYSRGLHPCGQQIKRSPHNTPVFLSPVSHDELVFLPLTCIHSQPHQYKTLNLSERGNRHYTCNATGPLRLTKPIIRKHPKGVQRVRRRTRPILDGKHVRSSSILSPTVTISP